VPGRPGYLLRRAGRRELWAGVGALVRARRVGVAEQETVLGWPGFLLRRAGRWTVGWGWPGWPFATEAGRSTYRLCGASWWLIWASVSPVPSRDFLYPYRK
jgi:hypothetical protein